MQDRKSRRFGGTATDLLVAVPLVAMLGAVAANSFSGAQIRSKVSEARQEMSRVAVALEAYHTDRGVYPFDGYNSATPGQYNYWYLPRDLSTPVAYLDSVNVVDPFRPEPDGTGHWQFSAIRYRSTGSTWGIDFNQLQTPMRPTPSVWYDGVLDDVGGWMLLSVGPDGYWGPSASSSPSLFPGGADSWETPSGYPNHFQPYDPTNGTNSWGDIIHTQINPWGYVNVPPPQPPGDGWSVH